jgi:ligand-binding SRPBCC domain-containing protein
VDCQKSAVPNELFRIEATQFGLPIRWLGRWEKVERPVLLVDSGVELPFKIWRHSHIFEEHPSGCLMTDRVEFLLKGGWPGWLISTFVMPYIFGAMFRARHEATRRWFANQ